MHLVQLFLPLRDASGAAFERALYAQVREELTRVHGGVTAYQRSPAVGLWEAPDGDVERVEWLYAQWQCVDDWLDEVHPLSG